MAFARWQLLALVLATAGICRAEEDAPLTYERHVRPILKSHCFICHGETPDLQGGLDLRLRRLIVAGGESGPAIVPGKLEESYLFQRVAEHEMPPGDRKKLSAEQVAVIGRWIAQGANTAAVEPAEPVNLEITPEERQFWSFQPIKRPEIPRVQHADRVRTPVDAFLLVQLESHNLSFSPDTDKRTLLRRVYFDLIGLPPTPEEAEQFFADPSADAYERLIDRLLESPHYGERWGRHWLDVAGYADSEGQTTADTVRQDAYKYRDYVINAFNADKPWDQFIQEQLAGDEMAPQPYLDLKPLDIEKLVATGFLRMAPDGTGDGGVDQDVARNQVLSETIKIVSTSLLGLSVGCAQCHNHRYDPIPQTDYYRLRAIFEPAYDWKNWRTPPQRLVSLYTDTDREQARQVEVEAVKLDQQRSAKLQQYIDQTLEKELNKLPAEMRELARAVQKTPPDKRTPEQTILLKEYPSVNVTDSSLSLYDQAAADDLKKQAEQAAAVRTTKPKEEFIRALTEIPGQLPATYLFSRGDPTQPRQALSPGELSVLCTGGQAEIAPHDPSLPTSGRRLAYARWLTSGQHPLLARVLVNRIWLHHFGSGIVATPGDFGVLGARPTHPELLDWLASDFVSGGWRLKRLHKLIMTSTAYRQTSRRESTTDAVDRDNHLYGRLQIRRLEAEALRDSMLAVSGQLNPRMFGPPVPVREDEVGQIVIGIEKRDDDGRPGPIIPMQGEEFRRSIYVQFRRSRPLAALETFDFPAMEPNCPVRSASTVAPQALMLMNGPQVLDVAVSLAQRIRRESSADLAAQVTYGWRLAYASDPSPEQLAQSLTLLAGQAEQLRAAALEQPKPADQPPLDPDLEALSIFCQALISSNGFLYID